MPNCRIKLLLKPGFCFRQVKYGRALFCEQNQPTRWTTERTNDVRQVMMNSNNLNNAPSAESSSSASPFSPNSRSDDGARNDIPSNDYNHAAFEDLGIDPAPGAESSE
jgi:hypothetical protein